MAAIQLHKIAPGLLDRYLALTAYDGQQTDEPDDPARPDNLFRPVDVDAGAHGRFDDVARVGHGPAPVAKRVAALAGVGLAAAGVAVRLRRPR